MADVITIIENIICFFDYFSFFYIMFQKDFRGRSNKKIAGILICVIAYNTETNGRLYTAHVYMKK